MLSLITTLNAISTLPAFYKSFKAVKTKYINNFLDITFGTLTTNLNLLFHWKSPRRIIYNLTLLYAENVGFSLQGCISRKHGYCKLNNGKYLSIAS